MYSSIIEAIIFASTEPISEDKIKSIIGNGLTKSDIGNIVEKLNEEYDRTNRAFRIEKVAGGYILATRQVYYKFLQKMNYNKIKKGVTHAAMECLAIIALKQPITRIEIDQIRGVNSVGAINSLLEKELITIAGRKKVPGNPLMYKVTDKFLFLLGINSLEDLPDYNEYKSKFKELEENREKENEIKVE